MFQPTEHPPYRSDKSTATTFAVVHREQNDPRIHDASSSSVVFQEVAPPQSHKIKNRSDLESEFGSEIAAGHVRDNEGEAAEYGVYFDDTQYDYMQHMRDLGDSGGGEAYFVEAKVKGKAKARTSLEDALRDASLDDGKSDAGKSSGPQRQLLDEDILPSKNLRRQTYQDQQNVPDALAGLQPDMDPRLREVLEALEDEAYVDDEEDVFGELAKDGEEVSLEEFEDMGFFEDGEAGEDGGWESDDTTKPSREYKDGPMPSAPSGESVPLGDGPDHGDGDWMKEFSKFKLTEKPKKDMPKSLTSELQSSVMTGTSMTSNRRKKRKGAMTSSTGYSMTSSSLFRTEGLTLLDSRFEKIEEQYAEDGLPDGIDDGASVMSGMTGTVSIASSQASQAPPLRSDFDNIMDQFLGGYSMSGKRRLKKGGYQTGMEQLDEVRKGLGPARLKTQKTQKI